VKNNPTHKSIQEEENQI